MIGFVLAMTAVTWVARIERQSEGCIDQLRLVEIVDTGRWENYICTICQLPLMREVNIILNDGYLTYRNSTGNLSNGLNNVA